MTVLLLAALAALLFAGLTAYKPANVRLLALAVALLALVELLTLPLEGM